MTEQTKNLVSIEQVGNGFILTKTSVAYQAVNANSMYTPPVLGQTEKQVYSTFSDLVAALTKLFAAEVSK